MDGHEVMRIFCMDERLSISEQYLESGVALGGSCLTKDVRAILASFKHSKLEAPAIEAILKSNENQVVIDSVRAVKDASETTCIYRGICW
jgi:GDP-mannose 6-dehydrogenase